MSHYVGGNFFLSRFAYVAVEGVEHIIDFVLRVSFDVGFNLRGSVIKLYLFLGLADFRLYAFDPGNYLLNLLVSEKYGVEHFLFGDLVGARFDHHDGVFRSAQSEIKAGFFALFVIGVDDVFAVHVSYHDGARGSVERNVGHAQSDGASEHTENFRRDIGIHRKRGRDNGNVVEKSFREQRTYRSVDKTGRKYRLIGRTSFPLFESAGNLAHGVHFLLEIHSEREIIHPFSRGFGHSDVGEHHGVAATDKNFAVAVGAIAADLRGNLAPADNSFENLAFFHFASCPHPRGLDNL